MEAPGVVQGWSICWPGGGTNPSKWRTGGGTFAGLLVGQTLQNGDLGTAPTEAEQLLLSDKQFSTPIFVHMHLSYIAGKFIPP